jgi:transposase
MSKFKSLKIVDKAKMLEDMKQSPNTSYRNIAAAYNVSVATVCRTVKRKLEITELVENNIDSKRKRKMKSNKNDNVNSIMNEWWNAVRIKNIPITGPMI